MRREGGRRGETGRGGARRGAAGRGQDGDRVWMVAMSTGPGWGGNDQRDGRDGVAEGTQSMEHLTSNVEQQRRT